MNRAAIGAAIGTAGARIAGRLSQGVLTRIETGKRQLFLTIDDGPSAKSVQVAEYLQEQRISATWFLVGQRADKDRRTVAGVMDAGHALGNHSYRHLDAWRSRWRTVEKDLDAGLVALERLIDGPCVWTRPPYGRLTPQTLRWCARHDQRLVLWDVLASDFAASATPRQVASRVSVSVRPGSIIAMHDRGRGAQLETFKRTIETLLNEGWAFRRLPTTT